MAIATASSLKRLAYAASHTDVKDIDLTAPYEVPTVEQLESALLYDLKPYAAEYLQAAEDYGINVYFLTAKDALESGWGREHSGINNLGGWTAGNGYKDFESVSEYIEYSARNLKVMYLTERLEDAKPDDIIGSHFHGCNLSAVNTDYNGSAFWLKHVSGIWFEIEWRCEEYATAVADEKPAEILQDYPS